MNWKIVLLALLVTFGGLVINIAPTFSIATPNKFSRADVHTFDVNSCKVQPAGDPAGGGIPR
mgnify:CR=1 FL=1